MERQVNTISRVYCHRIPDIGCIKQGACKTQVLVKSRLDCVIALPYDPPGTLMERLQGVHTFTARLVTRTQKREHITPVLNAPR